MSTPRFAVIGGGLIGSAAAKYLAEAGHNVTLYAPAEPKEKTTHSGVFGSHYDEGRITRKIDPSPFWSQVTKASINRYRDIETRSGIKFFSDVGALVSGPSEHEIVQNVFALLESDAIPCDILDDTALAAQFPMFRFPEGTTGFYERAEAGHISPRNLVAAQQKLAQAAGCHMIREDVTALQTGPMSSITTQSGHTAMFDFVLLSTGGFARHLAPVDIPLKTYARTIAFFRVSKTEAQRLKNQPSLIYRFEDGRDPYLLPPIRYGDGQTYLKIGGDPEDHSLETQSDINAWFRSGGNPDVAAFLTTMIKELMPDLAIESVSHGACVTSFTPDDRPLSIHAEGGVHIVAGACGKGAKCSDELGRRAAMTLLAQSGAASQTEPAQ